MASLVHVPPFSGKNGGTSLSHTAVIAQKLSTDQHLLVSSLAIILHVSILHRANNKTEGYSDEIDEGFSFNLKSLGVACNFLQGKV